MLVYFADIKLLRTNITRSYRLQSFLQINPKLLFIQVPKLLQKLSHSLFNYFVDLSYMQV